jgi:Photoprotection regulator fluorescence recovery protein
VNGSHTEMGELRWSPAEKAIARRTFERALGKELQEVIGEVKARAPRIEEPADLWDLERYLTRKRQEIDRKYDYRYSVLPLVFARLLHERRITEEDLRDLRQDKLDLIRRGAETISRL